MSQKKSQEWFEVSKDGLRELQEGKPKTFVLRELVANAFDEEITHCHVYLIIVELTKKTRKLIIKVTDDGGGFDDLKDAYTLYRKTAKRTDPTKRGRFTIGEKESFSVAMFAEIMTTKGSMSFDEYGRHFHPTFKSERGTTVRCDIQVTEQELRDIREFARNIIPPKDVQYTVSFYPCDNACDNDDGTEHGIEILRRTPIKTFTATLPTELSVDGRMTTTQRKTEVELFEKEGTAYLYEGGIPVTEIDCDYSINVSQRIPLSIDRDKVSQAYLKHLFAEVLNQTHADLTEDNVSAAWVRIGASDERVSKEAVKDVIRQRYGDKVVVATPSDPIANDDALASGYRVIRGSELSGEEWWRIREFGLLRSSHEVFGKEFGSSATYVTPDKDMAVLAELCKKIAYGYFAEKIQVSFVKSNATVEATFGNNTLTFNVQRLGEDWFKPSTSFRKKMALIVHELSHFGGHHTEMAYHQTMQELAAWLIEKAFNTPDAYERLLRNFDIG